MKLKKTLTALVFSLALLAAFSLGAYAADGLQEINAYLNSNITFKLEGEEQILTDATGARTYPITYNGTTYIPIRSVANLLGLDVNWDQVTQTILLGKQPGGIDLIDTYKAYYLDNNYDNWAKQYQSSDKQSLDISGVSCSHWVQLGFSLFTRGVTSVASFNLGGNHDMLTFSYYADGDITLQVLGDNDSVLFTRDVPGGQVAQTVTIPLFKTSQLTFEVEGKDGGAKAYIFNAYLDAE